MNTHIEFREYAFPCEDKPKGAYIKHEDTYVAVGCQWEVVVSEIRGDCKYVNLGSFCCKPTRKQIRKMVKECRKDEH